MLLLPPDLPNVTEAKSPNPPERVTPSKSEGKEVIPRQSRSLSRPAPPPKDVTGTPMRRQRNRSSGSMLRYSTVNPDLLSPPYVPTPQRKRGIFYGTPLKQQLAVVKTWFKESAKRNKSPGSGLLKDGSLTNLKLTLNGKGIGQDPANNYRRSSTAPLPQTKRGEYGWMGRAAAESCVCPFDLDLTQPRPGEAGSVLVRSKQV